LSETDAMRDRPLIVIGGGGHAKVLVSTILLQRRAILGYVDINPLMQELLGIPKLGDDDEVFNHAPDQVQLINGVGSGHSTIRRQGVYERFVGKGYIFTTLIHLSAVISPHAEIRQGVQVMAGAIVQPGTRLEDDVIVNTRASVDHDCVIDAHAHIAPGVTLSGDVHIGRGAHIGAGATIIQGIRVGAASVVGAGAVVVKDVPDGVTVAGVPAELLTHRSESRR
jgi:sugar O-acyltransferase (sialic acid O-acetyltransferase NeuD family)